MPNSSGHRNSVNSLRHAEYYGMQSVFDRLYEESRNGQSFDNLMEVILSEENILLAYRNIKANTGSNTAGTDGLTIKDIGRLTPEEVISRVRKIVTASKHGYRPRPVRRKEISKKSGGTRPLGIPCIWDRLIQQCIRQVMEPICEAKFSENSHGFRPARSAEHAIAAMYNRMQRSHLHYVVEFDIKGFFDNVNHSKLIKQIWALGIRDTHLIFILKRILGAPIRYQDGRTINPTKGTPQGGIISPLLANIVLNELDHWIESQWQNNPVKNKFYIGTNPNGSEKLSGAYTCMRRTGLKEMYIIRYADDFRILCKTKTDAQKIKIAVTQWLKERLKLEIAEEKTKIVNVKRKYSEFLGFRIKLREKSGKHVVRSGISKSQIQKEACALTQQVKNIANPRHGKTEHDEIMLYNAKVLGLQNYYCIATDISKDARFLHRTVMVALTNRLGTQTGSKLRRQGRTLTAYEKVKYGKSRMLRFVAGTDEPIYPVGYVQHKNAKEKRRSICPYTEEGRAGYHDNLEIDTRLLLQLMRQPLHGRSIEYADNRISLFSAQKGKCAITGKPFVKVEDIHCHHKTPRKKGGSDKYENLLLIHKDIHILIHASQKETIGYYLQKLSLTSEQLDKVNQLREKAGKKVIDL